MEAYRDLALTAAAFMRTLDLPEFRNVFAGMALQAYLPDSFGMLQEITAWAKRRVDAGGSPVKVRIVKGANMEMELLESSLYGWPLAPYDNKLDVDANWKRMVSYGLEPDHARAVRLGVASHNLFDVAFAYQLARRNQVTDFFTFEMIEGMANHVRRAVRETGQDLLAYAPVAEDRHFINAVAYLIRRLDENTGPRNFLRHLHRLQTGTSSWQMLADHFRASVRRMPDRRRARPTAPRTGSPKPCPPAAGPTPRASSATSRTPTGRSRQTAPGPRASAALDERAGGHAARGAGRGGG